MTTDRTAGLAEQGRTGTGAAILDRVALSPVGSRRIEETLAQLMAVYGLLFSLHSVPLLVREWDGMASPLGVTLVVLGYGTSITAGLTALLRRGTRTVFIGGSIAYALGVLVLPLALVRPLDPHVMPWLFSVAGIACGYAAIAARGWRIPVVYTLSIAAGLSLIRTSPVGGGLTPFAALLESAYTMLLALGLIAIVLSVRLAARSVDRAQTAALGRYADAQIDEAIESERTRTDALVHDSVLTTFLSAAGASTPDGEALAARMARNTMNVLSRATVASHVGPKVAVHDLLDRVRTDAGAVGDRFEYGVEQVRDHFVPEAVADAVVSAAVQAMSNSVKHAGGPEVPRTLTVQGTEAGGVRVVIGDRGRGFDPDTVASERLGVRVSIIERMRRVGGDVDLSTAPGRGTVFVLSWPAAAHAPHTPADRAAAVPA